MSNKHFKDIIKEDLKVCDDGTQYKYYVSEQYSSSCFLNKNRTMDNVQKDNIWAL
jgi:hypothetical protein